MFNPHTGQTSPINFTLDNLVALDDNQQVVEGNIILSRDPDGVMHYRFVDGAILPDFPITVGALKANGYIAVFTKKENSDDNS